MTPHTPKPRKRRQSYEERMAVGLSQGSDARAQHGAGEMTHHRAEARKPRA